MSFINAFLRSKEQEVSYSKSCLLSSIEENILDIASKDIHFSKPILTLNDSGIIFPQTITVIQGQKGSHKSRLTENLCAAFLVNDVEKDFIGFKVQSSKEFYVVYIDTERNTQDQFPFAIQKIWKMTGKIRPNNFGATSLITISREERHDEINRFLEEKRSENEGKTIIVILDVITDCSTNFNDPKDASRVLDSINSMINNHDVAFICVIHENPNNSGEAKARGHLGTELINKATTVISIGYDKTSNGTSTDLIAMKFLHTRNTKRLEPHHLRYDETIKGLVVADDGFVDEQKQLRVEKAKFSELADWIEENLSEKTLQKDLIKNLSNYFGCSDKTIKNRLEPLFRDEVLLKEKHGKSVYVYKKTPMP